MRPRIAGLSILLLLLSVGTALAQSTTRVHGYLLSFAGDTVMLRGDDGFAYSVLIGPTHIPLLKAGGQALTVVGRAGDQPHTLTATEIIPDNPTAGWGEGPNKAWNTTKARIVSVDGATMKLDFGAGGMDTVDISPIVGQLQIKQGALADIILEKRPGARQAAVWVFPPAATLLAVQTRGPGAPSLAVGAPSAAGPASARIEGHVVDLGGERLIVRAPGGEFYRVNVSGLAPDARASLARGQGVVVEGARGQGRQFMASRVTAQGAAKRYSTFEGTVQTVSGNTLTLRSANGRVRTFDIAAVPNSQRQNLERGDTVTLVFEPGQERVALWVENLDQPSAVPVR